MTPTELRVALTVDDFEAAVAFYRDALGMQMLEMWNAPGANGVLLEAGRATLELFDAGQAAAIDEIEVGDRVAGPVRLALEVDDSAALAEQLVTAGATRVGGPVVTPWGDRNVRLQTPDGMQLTLFTVSGE
jgi:catechol 2,3-dioxygenase-like lactoylglutathione lyase family enzyme